MLVAAMMGLDACSTMDMDATIKGASVNAENVEHMMAEIISVFIDDGVTFQVKSISEIKEQLIAQIEAVLRDCHEKNDDPGHECERVE